MLDYTTFRIAQQEYGELARRRPAKGICVRAEGPVRLGLGCLLVAVWRRLQEGRSTRKGEGTAEPCPPFGL